MNIPISIFNDVIGPVMRGPSSSHCAAALRIGRIARDLMDSEINHVLVEFDQHGSLATTHESQGSDMGLFGGLMGWDTTDERLVNSAKAILQAGIDVNIKISDFHDPHPNTYRLTLTNSNEKHSLIAVSTGGGMIEMMKIDGMPVRMAGDFYETLIYVNDDGQKVLETLKRTFENAEILVQEDKEGQLIQIKSEECIGEDLMARIQSKGEIRFIKHIAPVLPVLSRKDMRVPFSTYNQMLEYDIGRNLPLWELAVNYESERAAIAREDVLAKMIEIVKTLRDSIQQGICGTEYEDRILGYQCGEFNYRMETGSLLDAGLMNRIVLYVSALMEVKSSMGVIVAAPTAGACAALPGACLGASDALGLSDEDTAKAMMAAGLVGIFIAEGSTFAAEEAGCQAEC